VKQFLILALLILAGALTAHAQTGETVTISKEAAVKCLQDSDRVKALETENAALKQALDDEKKLYTDLKVDFAKVSGEKSQLEADRVRWTAVIDVLIKNSRPKKVGLINLF
jgi:hypothetical protein